MCQSVVWLLGLCGSCQVILWFYAREVSERPSEFQRLCLLLLSHFGFISQQTGCLILFSFHLPICSFCLLSSIIKLVCLPQGALTLLFLCPRLSHFWCSVPSSMSQLQLNMCELLCRYPGLYLFIVCGTLVWKILNSLVHVECATGPSLAVIRVSCGGKQNCTSLFLASSLEYP